MDTLKSLVQPLVTGYGSSSLVDGMKLVVLGGTVETARRVSSSAWSHFVNCGFFLVVTSVELLIYVSFESILPYSSLQRGGCSI
jgi:chaperone BCS1